MKYTKKRLQKLAGLLKEGVEEEEKISNNEKYKHNRVYHVVKHKMTQFLEEKKEEVFKLIISEMDKINFRASKNGYGIDGDYDDEEDEEWRIPETITEPGNSGVEELFYKFLGNDYLIRLLGRDKVEASEKENQLAAWAGEEEAAKLWLKDKYEDFKDSYEQAYEIAVEGFYRGTEEDEDDYDGGGLVTLSGGGEKGEGYYF